MGSIDLATANMYSEDEDDVQRGAELPPLSPTRGRSPTTNGEGNIVLKLIIFVFWCHDSFPSLAFLQICNFKARI